MQKILLTLLFSGIFSGAFAQKWGTRAGQVDFFSKTPLENIEARNKAVSAVVDAATGAVAVSLQVRDFKFERALMESHFNENYLESDRFPKAEFRGAIQNPKAIDWGKDGVYQVTVSGNLTIHGVSQKVTAPVQILVKDGKAGATGTFPVRLADYNIKIPTLVAAQIAESVDVTLVIAMQPL